MWIQFLLSGLCINNTVLSISRIIYILSCTHANRFVSDTP